MIAFLIINAIAIAIIAVSLVIAGLEVYRSPTPAGRAIAAELIYFGFVGSATVACLQMGVEAIFDIILIATVLGFLATVSLARLIQRGTR
jgi:multicomponent Na+:H+ antiporter subunit F